MPRLSPSALLSIPLAARAPPALARGAAGNPHLIAPADTKLDVIKSALYPPDSVAPTSASPIGARHANSAARLAAALPSAEAYETIERAWALFRRRARDARESALRARFESMRDACDELEAVSAAAKSGLYDRAMVRMAHSAAANAAAQQGIAQGKKKTPESRFAEARPEGIVPREAWVPVETRGVGWKYEWERPANEW
jgi:large subunit ribosomal protein L40